MKVTIINQKQRNNITFKSGLTSGLLKCEKSINPADVEDFFINKCDKDFGAFYNIDLKGNNAHALANKLLSNLFLLFRKKHDYRKGYSMQNLVTPQDIYVFNNNEDFKLLKHNAFFTTSGDQKLLADKPVFSNGSVFISNDIKTLDEINAITEHYYLKNKISSSHFLQPYIHEWLHAIQNKLIKNYCDNFMYSFPATINNYASLKLSTKEKKIVSDVVGLYPTITNKNEYGEMFAESWSKFLCEALAPDCKNFIKDPIELLNKTPKEFQKILKKASNIKFTKD